MMLTFEQLCFVLDRLFTDVCSGSIDILEYCSSFDDLLASVNWTEAALLNSIDASWVIDNKNG